MEWNDESVVRLKFQFEIAELFSSITDCKNVIKIRWTQLDFVWIWVYYVNPQLKKYSASSVIVLFQWQSQHQSEQTKISH